MFGMQRQSTAPPAPVDEFLDSYVSWREACEDVRAAYRLWTRAGDDELGGRFETYRLALAHEEEAALALELSAERLGARVR
jgi:hypothetical protein